jgi:hypothetical protein
MQWLPDLKPISALPSAGAGRPQSETEVFSPVLAVELKTSRMPEREATMQPYSANKHVLSECMVRPRSASRFCELVSDSLLQCIRPVSI